MSRKHRFLAALLGVLLMLSLAVPALADEADSIAAVTQSAEEGDVLPPDGDDSPILPPDDGSGEPSDDPSSEPGQDPGSEPSDDPSSDPGSSEPSDDPASSDPDSDDPGWEPGGDDPDGDSGWDGGSDENDGYNDPGWDTGYTYEPSDDFEYDPEDDNFAGGTITNTAPGSTGSTTPRRPQQVLGGTSSAASTEGTDDSQAVTASVEASGPQYVTFARLNLRSNSMALTLFYGGAGCIALGVLGLVILLIVLVRSNRKNHRDRLIEEIAHAETQAARTTETAAAAAAGTGRHVASHMRKAPLKHSASRKNWPEDR